MLRFIPQEKSANIFGGVFFDGFEAGLVVKLCVFRQQYRFRPEEEGFYEHFFRFAEERFYFDFNLDGFGVFFYGWHNESQAAAEDGSFAEAVEIFRFLAEAVFP